MPITVHGGAVSANGILVTANGLTTPGVGDFLTINNTGDIIVRISNDDGATFLRGMAIDVAHRRRTTPSSTCLAA